MNKKLGGLAAALLLAGTGLTSTVQALVFTLLSTVYIALMLPHEHEEHGGGEALGH